VQATLQPGFRLKNIPTTDPMKKMIIPFLLVLTLGAKAQESMILVTPQWLNDHINDANLVILQPNYLQFEYDKEHIKGARYLWPGWMAPDSPKGAYNAPDIKSATTLLRSLGISNDTRIVLCHVRNEVPVTARMFLTLEHFGLKGQVSFLNGGLEAWKKAGYSVTKEVPTVKKGKVKLTNGNLLVDSDYVVRGLSGGSVIVDARATRYYDGEPVGNPRDGHITGAKNIPYQEMIDASNIFKPADQLQAYFTPVVPDKKQEVVTYCFIGQTASVVYLAGRILGYDMKLYDGSMQEWSRVDGLPMEVTVK
jgi:thiosulfate/3-mercaptopyruvate sulfurtransferase